MIIYGSSQILYFVPTRLLNAEKKRPVFTKERKRFTDERPERLIGDKAHDSDPLDEELAEIGVEAMES